MKRSERFLARARRAALWACAILTVTVAGCIWSVRVMQDYASGGTALFILSLAGLFLFGGMVREALHLIYLARNEAEWERRQGTRPRI